MQIKGTAILALLTAITKLYGSDGLAEVKGAMPDEHRRVIDGLLMPTAYYPVALAAALHEAVRLRLGNGSTTVNRRIASEAAREDFSGIYKVFFHLMKPEAVLKRLNSAFKQYNSQGQVAWSAITPSHAEGVVKDVSGWTEPMWHALMGRLEVALALAGARLVIAKLVSFADHECVFHVDWMTGKDDGDA